MSILVMKLFLLISTYCLVAASLSAQPHHSGIFAVEGGTGDDGCQANYQTTQAVNAYSEPTESSEHIRTVDANRRIDWNDRSEALTVVIRPAIFRALQDVSIGGDDQSTAEETTMHLAIGDRIEVLAYAGEGDSYFRRDGNVYIGHTPGIGNVVTGLNELFELELEPVIQIWVRLIDHGGKPRAWVNVSQPGVEAYGSHCEG